jgi:hypothetical protein
MVKYIVLFSLSVFFKTLTSQNINQVQWGDKVEHEKPLVVEKSFKIGESLFYLLHENVGDSKHYYLHKVNSKGVLGFYNELIFPSFKGHKVRFLDIDVVKNKIIVFGTYRDKKVGKVLLFKVSEEGDLDVEGKKIMDYDWTSRTKYCKPFEYIFSSDSSKVLFYSKRQKASSDNKNKMKYNFLITNSHFEELVNVNIEFEGRKFFHIMKNRVVLSDEGDVHMICMDYDKFHFLTQPQKLREKSNKYLISLTNELTSKKRTTLGDFFKGYYLKDVQIFNSNDELKLVGFCSKSKEKEVKSYCYLTLNIDSHKVGVVNVWGIGDSTLFNLLGNGKYKEKKRGIEYFEIKESLLQDNGDLIVVAEESEEDMSAIIGCTSNQNYKGGNTSYTSNGQGGYTANTTFSGGGAGMITKSKKNFMIIYRVSSSGQVLWEKAISKESDYKQIGEDKIMLILSDRPKNITPSYSSEVKVSKKDEYKKIIYLVTINSEGKFNRVEIFNPTGGGTSVKPENIQLIGEKLFLYSLSNDKSIKIGVYKLNKKN